MASLLEENELLRKRLNRDSISIARKFQDYQLQIDLLHNQLSAEREIHQKEIFQYALYLKSHNLQLDLEDLESAEPLPDLVRYQSPETSPSSTSSRTTEESLSEVDFEGSYRELSSEDKVDYLEARCLEFWSSYCTYRRLYHKLTTSYLIKQLMSDPSQDPTQPQEVERLTEPNRPPVRNSQEDDFEFVPPRSPLFPNFPAQPPPPQPPKMPTFDDKIYKHLPTFTGDTSHATARGHILGFQDYCQIHSIPEEDWGIKYVRFGLSLKGKAREWYENNKIDDPSAATRIEFAELLKRFASRYGSNGSSEVGKYLLWSNLSIKEGEEIDEFVDRLSSLATELGKSELESCIAFSQAMPQVVSQHLFIDANAKLHELVERAKQQSRSLNMMQGSIAMDIAKSMPPSFAQASTSTTKDGELKQKIEELERKLVQAQLSPQLQKQRVVAAAEPLTKQDVDKILQNHVQKENIHQLVQSSKSTDEVVKRLQQRIDSLYEGQVASRGPPPAHSQPQPREGTSGQNSRNQGQRRPPGRGQGQGQNRPNNRTKRAITQSEIAAALADDSLPCPIHGTSGREGPHPARLCRAIAGSAATGYDPNYTFTPRQNTQNQSN